jgi:hypothetical protein
MYKPYSSYERQNMRCSAIDDGVQCERGVRNIKRMLCNMHNSRWQRHGKLGGGRKYIDADLKEQQRLRSRHFREEQIKKSWSTFTCLCMHTYAEHKIKGKCLKPRCRCKMFSGAGVEAVTQMRARMSTMGFVNPIGDKAYCLHCQEYVQIGRWFDGNVIQRMREHLKYHLTPTHAISRYGRTA